MSTVLWSIVAVFLGLSCTKAFTGTAGKIAGAVKDKNTGAALPGVQIILEGAALRATTDSAGRYFIFPVFPGGYTLAATAAGYDAERCSQIDL